MSERKSRKKWLKSVGCLVREKRMALGEGFEKRDFFVDNRSKHLFNYEEWISSRYLASIELGNNQMSLEKMIQLAYALEVDPVEFFSEILKIYQKENTLEEEGTV